MKNDRIVSFDYLRAIAPFGILLGHFFQGIGVNWEIVFYLGTTFNAIFFAMSSILLGEQWLRRNFPKDSLFPFLRKRIKKLSSSYYPFLILVFLFFYLMKYPFTLKDVIGQFAYLSLFIRFDELGQLWFLTVTIICYVCYVGISHIRRNKLVSFIWLGGTIIFLILIGILGHKGIRGIRILTWIPLCCTIYMYIDKINRYNQTIKKSIALVLFLSVNISTFILLGKGLLNISDFLGQLLCIACGLTFVILFRSFEENLKKNKIISYLASISYEIYMVHYILCEGKFAITNYFQNLAISFLFVILLSIIFSDILHRIGNYITKKI